jgi:hypothetical protein
MAISHVNGITAANISHFNGIVKANVSAIDGVTASFGGGSLTDPNPKSLVHACGFECGQLGAEGQHWVIATGTATISTSTVRSGDRSLRLNPSAAAINISSLISPPTIHVARFYIYFTTLPSADTQLYRIATATGPPSLGLGFHQSSGELRCSRGSNTFNSTGSGVSVTTGQWYRIDIKIDSTSGAKTCDASVNGSALGQVTGSDTEAPAAIRICNSTTASGDWFYDDVIMSQTSGDYPLGAGHVHHFIPVSDGTHNTGAAGNFLTGAAGANITNATTTSYQLIDEVPLDDVTVDTNDYINLAGTAPTTEYVEHVIGPASGISTPTVGPRGVEIIYGYASQSTGVGAHILKINDNGTEDTVNSFSGAGQTTNRYARKHYVDPPTAASAWTVASGNGNFNDLRTRFGYSTDGNPDQYLTCLMIEAEFSD